MTSDLEKSSLNGQDKQLEHIHGDHSPQRPLKLDRNGIPLAPQPTDSPADPLNWPRWQKVYVALLVALLGCVSQLGSALINPAFVQMSKDLHVTVEQASYCTTVFILFGGVAPIFIVPFANVYGRRPPYIIFIIIAAVGQFVSAAAPSYGGVITGRVINGIGASVPLGLGPATICDLFTQGERGLYMGIYTVMVTNGPHIGKHLFYVTSVQSLVSISSYLELH